MLLSFFVLFRFADLLFVLRSAVVRFKAVPARAEQVKRHFLYEQAPSTAAPESSIAARDSSSASPPRGSRFKSVLLNYMKQKNALDHQLQEEREAAERARMFDLADGVPFFPSQPPQPLAVEAAASSPVLLFSSSPQSSLTTPVAPRLQQVSASSQKQLASSTAPSTTATSQGLVTPRPSPTLAERTKALEMQIRAQIQKQFEAEERKVEDEARIIGVENMEGVGSSLMGGVRPNSAEDKKLEELYDYDISFLQTAEHRRHRTQDGKGLLVNQRESKRPRWSKGKSKNSKGDRPSSKHATPAPAKKTNSSNHSNATGARSNQTNASNTSNVTVAHSSPPTAPHSNLVPYVRHYMKVGNISVRGQVNTALLQPVLWGLPQFALVHVCTLRFLSFLFLVR